jgi:AbrB family looped-hinge helix DNA binding protein
MVFLYTMRTDSIQMDKAGRIVLPKPVREQLNLLPGDKLRLSIEGGGIRLEPTSPGGNLVRKGSVLVFSGEFVEPITTKKVEELISNEREGRLKSRAGKIRKK